MSQKELLTQLITKLRTDATLVSLTGHTSSDMRIGRDSPGTKPKKPFLGILLFQSVPMLGADVTNLQRAVTWITAYSTKELTCIDIADRVEKLLHVDNPTNLTYYDFTGGTITNKMTRFVSRSRQLKDQNTDTWSITIKANVMWLDQTCV